MGNISSHKTPFLSKNKLIRLLQKYNLYTIKIIKALGISEQVHKLQKRDKNVGYLEEHIYPITYNIIKRHNDREDIEKLILVSIMHDVIEDSDLDINFLKNNFGTKTIDEILLITKKSYDKSQSKSDVHKQMVVKLLSPNMPIIAKIVKIEDRINNLQSSILIKEKIEKYLRYIKESKEIYLLLAQNIGDPYPKILQKEIHRLEQSIQNLD